MTPVSELPFLNNWQNFYMLMGQASATLMGLMFVVITLIGGIESYLPTLREGISAFNTPTVVHFGVVLLLAVILSAPWSALSNLGLVLSLLGLAVVVYLIIVVRRMRHVPDYPTPLKDWLWYMVFPLGANIAVIVAAIALSTDPSLALSIISLAMVVLLFLGIHNAWDAAQSNCHPDGTGAPRAPMGIYDGNARLNPSLCLDGCADFIGRTIGIFR